MMSVPLSAKILFIDDDAKWRAIAKDYFEDNGFIVIEADSGETGLAICEQERAQVVVMDLQMPGLAGVEVLRILTQQFPEIPVLVLSDAAGLNEVIQALRIGAWDYLTKPIIQLPVLEHAVCRALERSRLIMENRIYREKLEQTNDALKESGDFGRRSRSRSDCANAVVAGTSANLWCLSM